MPGWISAMFLPLALVVFCAALSYAANLVLMPVFRRYALARPNARSSHTVPTPQGGGAAMLLACAAGLLGAALTDAGSGLWQWQIGALAAGTLMLALAGAWDDLRPLPILPRLAVQVSAAGLGITAIAAAGPISLIGLPAAVSMTIAAIGLIWFINLSNFMDGIDGITLAEFLPVLTVLVILALLGVAPATTGLIAAALGGALAGFAPFNRYVARLFLGDVGSLAIGFIAGCLLLKLALAGHFTAALILPLYYLADATITLARRLLRGERVTQAHRTHFYQRATDLGWRVPAITWAIAMTNIGLGLLAIAAAVTTNAALHLGLLVAAGALTGWLLLRLSRAPAS